MLYCGKEQTDQFSLGWYFPIKILRYKMGESDLLSILQSRPVEESAFRVCLDLSRKSCLLQPFIRYDISLHELESCWPCTIFRIISDISDFADSSHYKIHVGYSSNSLRARGQVLTHQSARCLERRVSL